MDGHRFNRRRFLSGASGLAAALLAAGPRRTWAGPAPPRYYIFCYFEGGWDSLLSLDPRDPTIFHPGRVHETAIDPGYVGLAGGPYAPAMYGNLYLGPFMGTLTNFASRMSIVRGMSMETLAHDAGYRRFLTGKQPAGGSARGTSLDVQLAAHLGQAEPIPNLSIGMESYNRGAPSYASATTIAVASEVSDAVTKRAPRLASATEDRIELFLQEQAQCDHVGRSLFLQVAEQVRAKSVSTLSRDLASTLDYSARLPHYPSVASHPAAQSAALAARAVTSGLSRVVGLGLASGLDTHSQNAQQKDQGPRQQQGFEIVAGLCSDLEATPHVAGGNWLDYTTILCFSEFGRGSLPGVAGGRDHSLANAALIVGGPLGRGRVFGATSDVGMAPLPMRLATGAAVSDGTTANDIVIVRPEHILQTLFIEANMAADAADLRVPHIAGMLV